MPDNTREIQGSTAPSGAADALNTLFQQNQELEHYAKKKDIDTGAAIKLKTQENEFQTGLVTLHQKFNLQSAQNASDLALQKSMQVGTAMNELTQRAAVAQSQASGVGIPGLTQQGPPENPMQSAGEASLPWNAQGIHPLAAAEAKDMFIKTFESELRKSEKESGISFQAQRDEMKHKLGYMTTQETQSARTMAAQLRAVDPNNPQAAFLDSFTSDEHPAQASDWVKHGGTIAAQIQNTKAKLEQINAQGASRMAIMSAIHATDNTSKERIAALRGDTAAANKAMGDLTKLKGAYATHLQSLQSTQLVLNQQINSMTLGAAEQKAAQAELAQNQIAIQQIQGSLSGIETAMLQHLSKSPTPTPPSETDIANIQERIKASVFKANGITDPAKATAAQKKKAQAEFDQQFADWQKKTQNPK